MNPITSFPLLYHTYSRKIRVLCYKSKLWWSCKDHSFTYKFPFSIRKSSSAFSKKRKTSCTSLYLSPPPPSPQPVQILCSLNELL